MQVAMSRGLTVLGREMLKSTTEKQIETFVFQWLLWCITTLYTCMCMCVHNAEGLGVSFHCLGSADVLLLNSIDVF